MKTALIQLFPPDACISWYNALFASVLIESGDYFDLVLVLPCQHPAYPVVAVAAIACDV